MTSVSPLVANRWPRRGKLLAELAVVVDLTIQDDAMRAVLVVDRLVSGFEVDHPQALNSEPRATLEMNPARVGAAMLEQVAHRLERAAIGGTPIHSHLTADSTHAVSLDAGFDANEARR